MFMRLENHSVFKLFFYMFVNWGSYNHGSTASGIQWRNSSTRKHCIRFLSRVMTSRVNLHKNLKMEDQELKYFEGLGFVSRVAILWKIEDNNKRKRLKNGRGRVGQKLSFVPNRSVHGLNILFIYRTFKADCKGLWNRIAYKTFTPAWSLIHAKQICNKYMASVS